MDKRKNNGGARPNAGRKPKVEEEKVRKLGLDAIERVYGSIEEYYEFIATESKTSFPHLKLLQEYVFGKPKESIDHTTNGENLNPVNVINLGSGVNPNEPTN